MLLPPFSPPRTFEFMAAGLAPSQRGRAAFTVTMTACLLKSLSSLWSANSSSSPSSRRGLTDEQRFPPRWALFNVGPVVPRRTYYREGDGGRPTRMVAEVYSPKEGPPPQQQQKRGALRRRSVILWEKVVANPVQLIGRIRRDIETKYLESGKVVATTSLAVHKGCQRIEDPSWYTLQICDDLAEIAAQRMAKGELILGAEKIFRDTRVKNDVRSKIVNVVVMDSRFVEPSSYRKQPDGQSNYEFTVRGSSSQSEADVASMDSSHRNWNEQLFSSQPSQVKRGAVYPVPSLCTSLSLILLPGFQGSRGHGSNVAQVEVQSPQTRSEASEWRETAKMVQRNWNLPQKVVGGIESRQHNTDSSKVELQRVGDIKANLSSSMTANDVLEVQERELLSREDEGQSSPFSEREMTENLERQDLRTQEVARNALRMDGPSSPASMKAGLNLTAQGRLQSRANYGSRDCFRDTALGNDSNHKHSAGTTTEAIAGVQKRVQRDITTNSSTYVKILQMCLQRKDLLAAKQVHDCIIKGGMDKNPYLAGTLLNVYIKCGGLLDARRVFDCLEKKTLVDWTSMIAGYANNDNAVSAFELFKLMRQGSVRPDQVTYLCVLKAFASPSALKWGTEVHDCIRHAGFESDVRVGTALLKMYAKCGCITEARRVFEKLTNRNVITWTVMIGGLAQHGYGHEAYRLFLQMRREGFEPNAFTYASILNPSASAGAFDWVKEVHGHASEAGLESDLRVGNALVHMYAESGSIDDARQVFDRMEKRDVVTWTIMIGGLAQHGCGHEALELFNKMSTELVKPNGTTFVALLLACCHRGLVDDGRRLFLAMTQDYGIEPTVVHYTCMVDLLGRAGHLEDAKLFVFNMPIEPNVVTWKALLGACRTHGNVELGEFAAKEVFKLEPNDASAYVLLSNIYAAAGKWEKVSSVRTMMQERRVKKEPGRSWIEVDNRIHEFVVGDISHPAAEAIYTEMIRLSAKLKAEGYRPDTRLVLHDISEEDKELALCSHSEKLAIVHGLMSIPRGKPIRVYKNLRVCSDCHTATKFISKVTGREIIARDASRFHHFKDGVCSCGDYW